ncbi:hypothetical protein AJ79_00766 [Helicocarpus griseus UAMH5409]|uniref:Uncharacterized protein n=1 Tax=Helicocarpus griseus UAMH5409 TaxID=1447875 RepID=A0A2B7YC18_9EURO|nr:hypothetical protein AJ79_00766 [Helicocarpus griseus UAMH5409]
MSQPSPMRTERRVLVEKSTNASLTPSNSQNTLKSSMASSKPSRDMHSISSPVLAGQKRSIDQVDPDQNTSSSAKSSSFSQSQPRREDEFYIYEENNTQSSTDVDKQILIPSSSLQNTYSFDKKTEAKNSSSQRSESMSSLLNLSFASESSPKPSQQTPLAKATTPTPSSTVPTDPAQRKAFIQEKADLLRNRVQSAMKNIKSHQIDRRLSELEAQATSRDRPCIPHPLRPLPRPISEQRLPQGDEDLTPRAKKPKLLPAPVLHPTDYSARYPPANNMLSSPPASASGENEGEKVERELQMGMHAKNESTPTQAKVTGSGNNDDGTRNSIPPEIPTSPVQPCSPPHTGDSPVVVERDAKMCSVDRMLAKAKKGEAVDGLLKLMKTTTEYDNLDEWTG